MNSQPIWKLVAQLGDVDPAHGASFVYIDETGVYPPEMEVCETWDDGSANPQFHIHRFSIEKLKAVHNEWFTNDLQSVADYIGSSLEEIDQFLTSDDIRERAQAYLDIASYFGLNNFDYYPLRLEESEMKARYENQKICA